MCLLILKYVYLKLAYNNLEFFYYLIEFKICPQLDMQTKLYR